MYKVEQFWVLTKTSRAASLTVGLEYHFNIDNFDVLYMSC
jgi:hypothetical protein